MDKTKVAGQDMELVNKTWNDMDVVFLDLMKMGKAEDIAISLAVQDMVENARNICKRLTALQKAIAPTLDQKRHQMYWMVQKNSKWITCSYGTLAAEQRGELTHELKLVDPDGNTVYKGRCSNPSLSDNPFEPQHWAEYHGCTGTYFRKTGENNWQSLRP